MTDLVGHHSLELLTREPRESPLGDADDSATAQIAERERVEAQSLDRVAIKSRTAGGQPHLLHDVGQALMVLVAGIERDAVHGPQQALSSTEPGEEPVERRGR